MTVDYCRSWNESQQPILPRCLILSADATSDQARGSDTFIFQQDNAPSHRAKDTIKMLRREIPDLIGPNLWPPNSPDVNLVDYKVWGVMQQSV